MTCIMVSISLHTFPCFTKINNKNPKKGKNRGLKLQPCSDKCGRYQDIKLHAIKMKHKILPIMNQQRNNEEIFYCANYCKF